jgi:NADPH2:quinone reductase
MKAIWVEEFGGPETLRLVELPTPRPQKGQVLIRVAAAGLNFADVNIRRGRYVMQPALPYVPGYEAAGLIEALGPGVDPERYPIGARVAALTMSGGAYAEYAVVKAAHTFPLPPGISLLEGAAFPLQALTAYHVLTTIGRLAEGETVVVQAAAGGVGTMSLQLSKLLGAGTVIAAAGGLDKLRLARKLGADEVVDYLRENLPARVNELTDGRGANLILESVGGQLLERSFECLSVLGRVVTFGNTSGAPVDLTSLWPRLRWKSQALLGFHLSAVLERPALRDSSMAFLLDLLAQGRLRVVVGQCFDLREASAAQTALECRRSTGKVLLKVGETT